MTRAAVIHPDRPRPAGIPRDAQYKMEEAVGLAEAIDLDVVFAESVRLTRTNPSTLLGTGTVARLKAVVAELDIEVLTVDAKLSPVQQRNLERALDCKVIDRTGLILEIFGARARTKEGQLQVELAALTYQRSRLVRSWTHLERQRGGAGFMGGPGERQIEIDRRLITDRIARLKKDLAGVKRTRGIHRGARKRVPYPVVALVGYTNAGKSTLFNRLTKAAVRAEDLLFATLDPTMRRLDLPAGGTAILSDTVGFISDLPTDLIAAFRATLEEVTEADLLVHVRDASHGESEDQRRDVEGVLRDLGLGDRIDGAMIEVLNKADLLSASNRRTWSEKLRRKEHALLCSALTGEGCDALVSLIEGCLHQSYITRDVDVQHENGALLAWLYRHGDVKKRDDDERAIHLEVRMAADDWGRFARLRDGADETEREGIGEASSEERRRG